MNSIAESYDVIVVGAGPAGLAAAATAVQAGGSVALIDAGAESGGQYWRGAAGAAPGSRVRAYDALVAELAGVTQLPLHWVHTITNESGRWRLDCTVGPEPRAAHTAVSVHGSRLILATGAYDRQLPFPGWDLPGVLTAGGVQALLKGHGVLAGRSIVVAGTGPFLLPVAAGLVKAGAQVPAVLEANSPMGFAAHPRAVLASGRKVAEAARYAGVLARSRTPYRHRHAVVEAIGDGRVEAVRVARLDSSGRVAGPVRTVACDVLAVGWGFTAQLELLLQVGCGSTLGADGGLVVAVDRDQHTDVGNVWAAGEPTGIGGSDLAVVEGRIAGLAATGRAVPAELYARHRRLRRFADALHAVHPVPAFLINDLPDSTTVCRCEEVTAGSVREAANEFGATDTRTVKLLARTGMGWCQGRVCGYATAQLTAAEAGRSVRLADLQTFAERPLAAPVPLRVLAESTESAPEENSGG
jgi:NADPH-dependent 2,4-dienoyl-CoA reductase/sulfur reductase-like enzyme